jgi:carboxypeptidase Taq
VVASHLGYKKNPYDALLDQFEPELTAAFAQNVFRQLKPELVKLSKQVQQAKSYQNSFAAIDGSKNYPIPDQQKIGQFLMKRMNYDLDAGRIDVSAHPFTTQLDRYDVRVTTAYKPHDFRDAFTSTMHEVGHALYEQGVNTAYAETPLEGGVSYGIHEALSRFWENMVGKNPNFLRFAAPLLQGTYPTELGNYSEDEIVKMFTIVKPSNIRIEADEVTYSLHIILRFEMENALLNEKITPEDAAEAWREKATSLFGVEPETDAAGVLQDVHWTYGAFGYFPSYALGNLYGAQFLATMKKTVKFEEDLGRGELRNILGWLNENIHTHGSLYYPRELIQKVTGKELDPQYFIDYLKMKYSSLYNFPVST